MVNEVLDQMDAAASRDMFPNLDNGFLHPLCARLHVFLDDTRWAIVIEVVSFSVAGLDVDDSLYFSGNCVVGGTAPSDDDILPRVRNILELIEAEEDGNLRDPTVELSNGTSIRVEGGELGRVPHRR